MAKVDLSRPRLHRFGFVAVDVYLLFRRMLVRCCFQVLLPLRLHGRIQDHAADQIGQNVKSMAGNSCQYFGR